MASIESTSQGLARRRGGGPRHRARSRRTTGPLIHTHPMKTTTAFQRTTLCSCLLSAFGILGSVSPALVRAQDANATVQRVEITGSSIKRVNAESSLPVQTV